MSKEEDNDEVKMSKCEKKSMVIQGIKDRSEDKGRRSDKEARVRR